MEVKGHAPTNWKFFKESYINYEIATELDKKDAKVRVATLLSVMGQECFMTYQNLPMTEEDRADPMIILDRLTEYFEPKRNTVYERYVFNTCTQDPSELIDIYVNRLRKLATTCEFGDKRDEFIRDRIVIGTNDTSLRGRLLREDKLTLNKCIDMCRASEQAREHSKAIEGDKGAEAVHAVRKTSQDKGDVYISDCKFCGTGHIRNKCPAYRKRCTKCNKMNHFSKVCRSESFRKGVHQVSSESVSDADEVYAVRSTKRNSYMVESWIKYNNKWSKVPLQMDNGSSVNTLSLTDWYRLSGKSINDLKQSGASLTAYGGTQIKPVGKVTLSTRIGGKTERLDFEVVANAARSLLSGPPSERLNLMKINYDHVVNQVTQEPTRDSILKDYADVFTGLGNIGVYHIELKSGARPTQDAPRRVPVALKTVVKDKLDSMTKQGILKKEEQPTDWISSAVYIHKPNKLRICLDPKELNKHIQIPKYKMPTLDDIMPNLSKATIFSVCDAKDGFLQVRLDDYSSKLTTFHTPFGRYRWLRLPFGVASAPEEFQRRTHEILEGLHGVYAIADDILVTGSGETMELAKADHYRNIVALLDRCRLRNYKLNPEKFKYALNQVSYHGHILTSEGLRPDPGKVEAITSMPHPKDKGEVKRLLGMVNYLSRFCPHLSNLAEPLRNLTKEDMEFLWTNTHDDAYQRIKTLIATAPTLKYYDIQKEVSVESDASQFGLGCVLTQEGQPVAFASRSMTITEMNYSQMEKEALALTFACEKFDQYLMGRDGITCWTDHKPLETIMNKQILCAPKRLQRMRLRLQKYKIVVKYKPGNTMYISDHLSRSSLPVRPVKTGQQYDIFAVEDGIYEELERIDPSLYNNVTDVTLERVSQHMKTDETMKELVKISSQGWPVDKQDVPEELRQFWPYRDEISAQAGIVYRGTRVIIPKAMRKDMLEKMHASHRGFQATLDRAKDSIFWPSISNDLKNITEHCETCNEHKPNQQLEPMQSLPNPTKPWTIVSSDILTIDSKNYLVLVDHFSRYFEVELMESMTAECVIKLFKTQFARHGIPRLVISDNGSQFSSVEFKKFARKWDFMHRTSSPHHPRGNSHAESAVKIAKALLRKASDPYMALLEWRNTPNQGSSPVQKLMSRKTRSLIPLKPAEYIPRVVEWEGVVHGNLRRKQVNKQYYDKTTKALPSLQVGDHIRTRTNPQTKTFWSPGQITEKLNNRSYVVEANGKRYRRNRSHIRTTKEHFDRRSLTDEDLAGIYTDTGHQVMDQEEAPEVSEPNTTENTGSRVVSTNSGITQDRAVIPATNTQATRSGRISRPPVRLQDYVVN